MQVAPQGGFIVRMGMLFRGGKATKRGYRFSRIVRANTRICGKRIPTDKAFPAWGRLRGGGFAAPKGSQPRLAVLVSPFQGKGLAWTLPPSYGRRCPEGAEVGWGKRYEKEREDRLKCVVYENTRAPLRGPPSPRGKAKRRGLRRPQRKPTPPRCARQPLPREGACVNTPSFLWKEVPRRGGGWMGKAG